MGGDFLREGGAGAGADEIRQKSQKFIRKYNKLTLANLSDCESVAATEKFVMFIRSLPLTTGVICQQKLPNWCRPTCASCKGVGACALVPHG